MRDEAAGDADAWVDRHGDGLYRYALARLRAPDLAADVVQETFLEAFRARGSFAGLSSERTWLVGILRHKILDHFRRAAREGSGTNGDAAANRAGPGSPFDDRGLWRVGPGRWGADPTGDLEREEFWEVFAGCLGCLPEGVARAFYLREVDGLDAEEVRSILGITPANLWARLHRARSQLRACLEARWFGRPASTRGKGPPPP